MDRKQCHLYALHQNHIILQTYNNWLMGLLHVRPVSQLGGFKYRCVQTWLSLRKCISFSPRLFSISPTEIKMSLTSVLSANAIDAALKDCQGRTILRFHHCSPFDFIQKNKISLKSM